MKMNSKMQYLHLSIFPCDGCAGPVVSGSIGVRENEISKETGMRDVGAICLACGHRPSAASEPSTIRGFPPVPWESATGGDASFSATA